jgi:hypothetical protein
VPALEEKENLFSEATDSLECAKKLLTQNTHTFQMDSLSFCTSY